VVGGSSTHHEGKTMDQPTQAIPISCGRCPAIFPSPLCITRRPVRGGVR
jgi:hypothetical protein